VKEGKGDSRSCCLMNTGVLVILAGFDVDEVDDEDDEDEDDEDDDDDEENMLKRRGSNNVLCKGNSMNSVSAIQHTPYVHTVTKTHITI
jgi:hypothetical protein